MLFRSSLYGDVAVQGDVAGTQKRRIRSVCAIGAVILGVALVHNGKVAVERQITVINHKSVLGCPLGHVVIASDDKVLVCAIDDIVGSGAVDGRIVQCQRIGGGGVSGRAVAQDVILVAGKDRCAAQSEIEVAAWRTHHDAAGNHAVAVTNGH